MDARVNFIILPLAGRLMPRRSSGNGHRRRYARFRDPARNFPRPRPRIARTDPKPDIREAIGPNIPALEESKADIIGMSA